MPMGRSSRIRRAYSTSRPRILAKPLAVVPLPLSRSVRSLIGWSSDVAESFARADPAADEARYVGLRTVQHQCRRTLDVRQQVGVADEVGDPQLHQARLTRAEQLAG